ncbi:hypothetical protein O0I10_013038 [Lichtheimia ornata]|uniref:Uncharacterized protein n=1 Tax=Lichtheimia ornata TaxID=688661 RepID=A0AAD7URN1_9FUNG|nr:uncharacterized protein O0I10_013038 [Lichtheimia ornata]KAJ8651419.1 hypothetical protein O0I10_013038 [Lichtheimia ornata]
MTKEGISWSQLLKDTIVTAQHGNDGNRIATATETLQQTAQQFVKVLNERARLLSNSAQFDTALRDAAAIRTILPGSGLGYLCMGDVYCQQGHHAAAISMYDQGLEAAPESNQFYHQLQQHRTTAATNNNKRVDFISRLPLDIVITNIVPRMESRLFSHELYGPLYVSRTWRKRFLQQPHGLDYHFGYENDTFKTGHDQLVRFAPMFRAYREARWEMHVWMISFLVDTLPTLNNLSYAVSAFTSLRGPFINGLQLIAGSLTHLTISVYPDGVDLRGILESCPNLTSLAVEEMDTVIPSLPSSSCYPKVAHLALHVVSDPPPAHNEMINLLSQFPSLLSFEITPMPPSSVLRILHEHCPYLQALYYGDRKLDSNKFNVHPNRKEIRLAHIGGGDNMCHQDDLIQFLYLHQNSLERIVFDAEIDVVNRVWRLHNDQVVPLGDEDPPLLSEYDPTQSKASFSQLVDIEVSDPDPARSEALLTWLILNTPNLKAMRLSHSHLEESRLANVMTRSERLTKLRVDGEWINYDFGGITGFLEFHIAKGNQSTLEELILYMNTEMNDGVRLLSLISRLKCLKSLEIVSVHVPEYWKPAFKAIGQGCLALENLTLGCIGAMYDGGLIKPLHKLPNLKCLSIGGRPLPSEDLLALIEFPKLERLYLHCHVPDVIMKMLRNHIPRVIIP